MNDLYDVLGVSKDATQSQIDKAYRAKASQTHPDKGGEHESFVKLSAAYEVLGDPQKRRVYDATGDVGDAKNVYDAAIDTIKILAAQIVMLPNFNPKGDLVNIILDHIKKEIGMAKTNINKNKELILKYGQTKSVVHSRTARNLIHEVLDGAIQKCASSIESDQRRIEICKACKAILKDYSYGLIQIQELGNATK